MHDPIEFAKLSGSGNDFILVDNRDGRFDRLLRSPRRAGQFARLLCRRRPGVGADGLIFAARPRGADHADVAARFFEADGSQTNLCGNGTACFVRWALSSGFVAGPDISVLTPAGVVYGRPADNGYVRVCIPLPKDIARDVVLDLPGGPATCDFVVMGVPHAVAYVDDVAAVDVAALGAAIRHHRRFQPGGVNANFAQVIREGEIALRTWEYGVEGETLACGTGSASAAILAAGRFGWSEDYAAGRKPVLIRARGGDVLRVYFHLWPDGRIDEVCLETVVRFGFRGRLSDELAAAALDGRLPRGH